MCVHLKKTCGAEKTAAALNTKKYIGGVQNALKLSVGTQSCGGGNRDGREVARTAARSRAPPDAHSAHAAQRALTLLKLYACHDFSRSLSHPLLAPTLSAHHLLKPA